MSWKFPPEPLKSGQAVATDNLNDNFLTYTEELAGALNEHNFAIDTGAPLTRDNLAKDAAFRLHLSRPNGINLNDFTLKSSWLAVRRKDDWQTFTNPDGSNKLGMGVDFNAVGSLCWICGSLQLQVGDPYLSTDTGGVADLDRQLGYGFNVAIQVDGVTVYESFLGSADSMNEFYSGDGARGKKLGPVDVARLDTPQAGGGINGHAIAVVVDTIIDVPPGLHDIKIAVMSIKGNNSYGGGKPSAYIANRELFVLELIR